MRCNHLPFYILLWFGGGFLVSCSSNQGSDDPGSISGSIIAPGSIGSRNNARPQVVPGEVIVRFKADTTARLQTFSVGNLQLNAVKTLTSSKAQLYRSNNASTLSQADTLALAEDLAQRSDVAYAHPNWLLHTFKTPDDEFYEAQWHYGAMSLPAAWDIEDGSSNPITVAVVDSGIVSHPDLQTEPGYDFISDAASSADGDARDADPTDEGGDSGFHGSHVTGTIGASTNNGVGVAGVNWNTRLVPVRALGVTGSGSFTDILEAIAWAAGQSIEGVPDNSNPARVINLSLGSNIDQPCPSEEEAFFQDLAAAGITVVVAAGNSSEDTSTTFPANCEGVITVGAIDPTGNRASYSNFGTAVDVMAPGGDITKLIEFEGRDVPAGVLSTVLDAEGAADYTFYNGTSMAAPHVSGLVSLLLARDPTLSFETIVTTLQAAATPLSQSECGTADGCGAGLVDAAVALGGTSSGELPDVGEEDALVRAFALYCLESDCLNSQGDLAIDPEKSFYVEMEQTRNAQPYTLDSLQEGTYVMAAWQDINNSGEIEESDPFGLFPESVNLQSGQQIKDIDIFLEAASATLRGNDTQSTSQEDIQHIVQNLVKQ
ncbi:MAG: S8 family peptidase [Trueperaceae bacterium]